MTRKQKVLLALVPFLLVGLWVGWRGLRYWWYRGYSHGVRSGILRKVSIKGPPYCKYVSGELVLAGSQPGVETVWEFGLDKVDDDDPLYKELVDLADKGQKVTLQYRQDQAAFFVRCQPGEYFVTGIEK
jgi:hypothetical protein